MKEETGYFSSFDGTKLFYRAWEKEEAQDALIIIHGIGEHSGRYQAFIQTLSSLKLSIFAFDLRGHGHSEGEKMYVNHFDDYTKDVLEFRSFVFNKKNGRKNFILLGQSMGGLIAARTVLQNQELWRALILLSPFFGLPFCNPLGFILARFLKWLGPKCLWKNPMQPAFLTHDAERVNLYKRDALVQRCLTGNLAKEMFQAVSDTMRQAEKINLPLLIFASGCDYIVSTTCTKKFFNRVSSQEKRIDIFKGYYHELLHEKECAKPIGAVKEQINNWLEGRH